MTNFLYEVAGGHKRGRPLMLSIRDLEVERIETETKIEVPELVLS